MDANNYQQINNVGEIQDGQFFVDEYGQKFLQKTFDQQNIKKRIFLHKNYSGRALHQMKVKYRLIQLQNQQSTNLKTNLKAVIESVEDTYSEIKPLIGFFSHTPKRPSIDFNLQSKQLGKTNLKKVYFFPLQINYPTMVLELDQSSQTCQSGDIFKYYYIVKVIDWPERLSREGPLVEIIDKKGMLYDQESDCQALLESLNMNITISREEKEEVDKIVKNHQISFQKNKNSKEYESLNVFTIDQQGAQAFDDAFSFQKINSQILEQEIKLAKQPKIIQIVQNQPIKEKDKNKKVKNGKKAKKGDICVKKTIYLEFNHNQSEARQKQQEPSQSIEEQKDIDQTIKQQQIKEPEEQKQSEPEQEDTECSRKIFKLGIHVADLSQSIKKDTPLYKALEKRGQSIYVPLGKNKSFVKHMLHRKLIQIFSLKTGEKKQAKSLFICIEKGQNNQFIFHWDSLRLENSIIESKQNYYYEEFDSYLKDNKQNISDLFKDDHDEEEVRSDYDDEDDAIDPHETESNTKNKSLILTNEEFLSFFNLGGQLFQQRIQKGQKAFQEEDTEKCKFLSSKLVEELMVFYNQSISRQVLVSQQIFQGQNDIEKKIQVLNKEAKQMKKSIKSNKNLIENKIKREKKVIKTNKKSIDTLRKNIKLTIEKIKNSPKNLMDYENLISTNQKKIEELNKQIEQIRIMEESEFMQEFNKKKKKRDQKKAVIQQENSFQEIENEQLSDSYPNQLSQLPQEQLGDNLPSEQFEEAKILEGEQDIIQTVSDKSDDSDEESDKSYESDGESDKSYDSDDESDIKSDATLQNNNQVQNDSDNIYTALKKRLNQQLKNLNTQQEQLDEELNNLDFKKNSNKYEEAKQSIYVTLDHYKKKCEQAGFNNLKYDSLLEFQSSIDKLKQAKITPIIKTYLIFEKRKIVRQLNEYFAICDNEKKQKVQLDQKIQQKIQQKSKIIKKIKDIQDRIKQAEKSEEEQKIKDLELQNQEKIEVEEEIQSDDNQMEIIPQIQIEDQEKSFSQDEDEDEDNINIAQLKEKKINQLQKQIKHKQKEIQKIQKQIPNESKIQELNSNLETYQKQSEKLKEQIKTQEIQIDDLKKQLDELKSEIQKINQNIEDEQKNFQQQLKKDIQENYKYFDITPESEKYLSLTSPIRKFNDIQAQQFIENYLNTKFSKEFDQEYREIIKSKQTNNKIKNQVAQFLEKAQKIKNCRKMILQAQFDESEILQINSKIIYKFIIYDFFLPKQRQIVQLRNDKDRPQLQQIFSIWNGQIQTRQSLPYNYTVAIATKNNIRLINLDF
ncbi:RNB-like protein (macronuclear) [Tetrahymena thermophila SB210]|uniref:RNB-like protein n=1 Tax=Tetrahymena thermophila (strain SB210) TaxID=312017 RepID=I7M7K5_TETTS|nr:RNB-like protein [Tetrahymena thermophila SB210]EAR94123.2 RNB-like protein [Tetrahymena thermophila SB210]|eukprot:XP_001014368.2 RNB-like protein [Tetrahymena thermophila SB210]